jgi:NAD-dependent protein deacetylase/lipoamidase
MTPAGRRPAAVERERAAAALAGGGVLAFTGAGISADSGVPTFRDPGGLWERFDPDRFGTWEGIAAQAMTHPDVLADFLAELRSAFGRARPNDAHRALADLERAGLLTAVVTQNVDGLHQEAGSLHVIEIHGSLHRRVCLVCGTEERVTRPEFLESLARAIAGLRTAFVPSLASILPRCRVCGGPTRPGFVAFGERPMQFEEASARAATCAAMLVVGTAGEVEPAATLPRLARTAGAPVVHVGAGETLVEADLDLRGRAATVLPELVRRAIAAARTA